MELDTITLELRSYIRKRHQIAENDPDFTDAVHLYDYGYIDSFGAVDLKVFMESQFSIKVSSSDLVTFPLNSIREVAGFITKRQKGEI
jgi:methoxymalonate biosynthesis acyl carrier protein